MSEPFQELLEDLQSGPRAREAQAKLYDLVAKKLLEPLRARMPQSARSRMDAEDVLHDALLLTIRSVSSASFENERQFLAWVYRIARNQMLDQAKRMSAQALPFRSAEAATRESPTLRESQVPSRARGTETAFQRKEEIEAVLCKLSEVEADVIRKRWLQGLSFDEIAVTLKKSRKAAKSFYARAWKRFRSLTQRSS